MGTYHWNPVMDTWVYKLEYYGKTHDRYFANIISRNLYSQVDSEDHQFLIFIEISDHQSYGTAMAVTDGFIIIRGRNKHP